MKTISVIIPTYNRPEFLKGAIETALDQTHDNLEVIVVDDGSEEPYASKVVSAYQNTVEVVSHDQNEGLSAARNTGIEASSGEYVAFLDDDDRWHETKLSRQVEAIERDNNAGLCTCLVVAISPNWEIVNCDTDAPSGDCSNKLLTGNHIGTPSCVLVRRECLDDIGNFDESLPTKQDWDLFLQICQDWNVAAVEDHLCVRIVHESMSSSPANAEDMKTVLHKHEGRIRQNGLWSEAKAEVLARVGRVYLHAGDLSKARTHLKEALSLTPNRYRGVLLLLCFTHPRIVSAAIATKRKIASKSDKCSNVELTPDAVPGLEIL